jgi:hypothetical protein
MEQVVTHGDRSSQQQQELHHQFHPEQITDRMGTPAVCITMGRIQEPHSRRIPFQYLKELTYGHSCSQQGHLQNRNTGINVENRSTSVARREESAPTLWDRQASTLMPRSIQNHKNHLPSSRATRAPSPMEYPPGISHQFDHSLH